MNSVRFSSLLFFFFNDTATTEIYTLSLHDALPICCADISGLSLYAQVMKKIGRAPWAVTTSLCFLAYRWNTGLSCGWIGHWLQAAMITASNCRPGLLKTISLSPTNGYFPVPSGLT